MPNDPLNDPFNEPLFAGIMKKVHALRDLSCLLSRYRTSAPPHLTCWGSCAKPASVAICKPKGFNINELTKLATFNADTRVAEVFFFFVLRVQVNVPEERLVAARSWAEELHKITQMKIMQNNNTRTQTNYHSKRYIYIYIYIYYIWSNRNLTVQRERFRKLISEPALSRLPGSGSGSGWRAWGVRRRGSVEGTTEAWTPRWVWVCIDNTEKPIDQAIKPIEEKKSRVKQAQKKKKKKKSDKNETRTQDEGWLARVDCGEETYTGIKIIPYFRAKRRR